MHRFGEKNISKLEEVFARGSRRTQLETRLTELPWNDGEDM